MNVKEFIFGIFLILFVTGIIPMGLVCLMEAHPVLTGLLISPVYISFGKEVIGDVLENYYN